MPASGITIGTDALQPIARLLAGDWSSGDLGTYTPAPDNYVAKPEIPPYAKAGPYVTQLSPNDESRFQQWVKSNNIPWQDTPKSDYDMRGFWKAQQQGNPVAVRAQNKHFPDVWKTPYDISFSNESMYALPGAPHWDGNKLVSPDGRVVFDESIQGSDGAAEERLRDSQNAMPVQQLMSGNIPQPPPKTKLQHLQDIVNQASAPPVQPDVSAGSDPNAMPPADLSDTSSQPTVKGSWFARHPELAKFLQGGLMLTEGGLVGSQYGNAGQGFQAAQQQIEHQQELPIQRMMAGLQLRKAGADVAAEEARTKMLQNTVPVTVQTPNGPVTYNVPQSQAAQALKINQTPKPVIMRNPNTGMIEGVQVGNDILGPNNPNFPADVKAMMANETPKQPTVTPEADKLRTRQLEKSLNDGTISDPDRADLVGRQREEKTQGVASEIVAQVGQPPVPAQYLKGANDPAYKAANQAWGKQVEAIKNREASASGAARGEGYNMSRPVAVIDPATGNLTYMKAGTAISQGAAPASQGVKAMSQAQQFKEMHVAAQKTRQAIDNLDRGFTPVQIAKLSLAFSHDDPTVINNEIDTIAGSQQLTPAQKDFVVWIGQLNERAMSLRNVAGMGQGSQDLREAIQNTLPGLRSGSKDMMQRQLAAFKNQINILEKGIPKVKNPNNSEVSNAPADVKQRDQKLHVVYLP